MLSTDHYCISLYYPCVYFTDSDSPPIKASDEGHVCGPIDQSEALEVLWTAYPPECCQLSSLRISRWIRPIIDGKEAWSLLGEQCNLRKRNYTRPTLFCYSNLFSRIPVVFSKLHIYKLMIMNICLVYYWIHKTVPTLYCIFSTITYITKSVVYRSRY